MPGQFKTSVLASALRVVLPVSFVTFSTFVLAENSSVNNSAAEAAVEVIAVYGHQGESRSATKLDLTVYETPQVITVVSRPQIEDFALYSVNDLLSYTPGVTVESAETERTYFTARGFDIVNFQYDGIGVPFSAGLSQGSYDTAIFEQIEVIKGAAGLVTGLANPSATINYLRKRPTQELFGYVTLAAGSENHRRLEGDLSGSISERFRGRIVAAKDTADSYLDRKADDTSQLYLVGEYDLTDRTELTLGHSVNNNKADGSLSGALPLYYTDGTPTNYATATSTATDWAYRDNKTTQTFAELRQQLSDDWSLNILLSQNKILQDAELFYVYGTPDKATELGLNGYASAYKLDEKHRIADIYLSGSYTLAGRKHELMAGVNYANIDLFGQSFFDYETGYPVLGADWATGSSPKGVFDDTDPYTTGHLDKQIHQSFYLATRLHLSDALSVLLGARAMSVEQSGYSYGVDSSSDASETVPYVGGVYQLNDTVSLYASYSEVFTPQSFVDTGFKALGVAKGDNSEVGVKFLLNNNRATASAALFRADLKNVGEFVEVINGVNTYTGLDYQSQGAELELTGSITDQFNLSFGYTWLQSVEGNDGQQVRTYVPRNLVKLSGVYYPQAIPDLSVGASVQWQDSIAITPETDIRIRQGSYALVDMFVRYNLSENLSVALNATNLTDRKHYESLYWTQAYYGAPAQWQAAVTWRY
ncbi:TonB-dependent siderophore receptor [Rheinheimera sp. EpRS3]|uniref:TonB-dependent siderophore receptor n=1 Tax=Rheinheimera sp. EpRS3 TaxID=1712383 RepID=UPI00074751EC|nr:TonB-dependent siderophore receptor [Rheinheimera sp. EpRS3]KUM52122.1 hypothetical protein AR688_02075 [Rheinheimera sp. EpRS3]